MAGKPIECKAAVLWAPNTDMVIETVTVAPPNEDEVRIKVLFSGICFSDVHIQLGRSDIVEYPIILGHESVGVVESIGSKVTSVKPGDNVIPMWCLECGECITCKKKMLKRNACERVLTHGFPGRYLDGGKRITCKGKEIGSLLFCGTFSEYTVVPEVGIAKIKSGIDLKSLAPFGCCVPTGYGAATLTARVKEGSTVAVWGLGAVGLCTVMGAKAAKAARIIGVDINSDKFDMAMQFGCTKCINPKDVPGRSTKDIIGDLTNLNGADYAFVCVGSVDAVKDAIECCSPNGGEIILVGLLEEKIEVDPNELLFGKTLKGSWGGDGHFREFVPELVDSYLAGKFPTDLLITHNMPLSKINEGFDLLKRGESMRTILHY